MRGHRLPSGTLTPKQLSVALGVSVSTVYRQLPRVTIAYTQQDIHILHTRGLSVRAIAMLLDAPSSTIHRLLVQVAHDQ